MRSTFVTGYCKPRSQRCNGGWSSVTDMRCVDTRHFPRTLSVLVGWNCHKMPKSACIFIRWRSVCTLLKLQHGFQNRGLVCHSL